MADSTQIDVEPEVLRSQMEQSREALAQKIEMLEEKVTETVETATANVAEATASVLETVQSATASVTDTVDTVTNAVQGTVQSVRQSVEGTVDNVKDAFDLRHQMELHPWWMIGGAVAVGYAAEVLVCSGASRTAQRAKKTFASPNVPTITSTTSSNGETPWAHREGQSTLVGTDSTAKGTVSGSTKTWLTELAARFAPEISHLEKLALGVVFGCVRDMVADVVPDSIRKQVTDVMDEFTEKVGGQRIDGPIVSEGQNIAHRY